MENLSIEDMREALAAYYEAAGFADINEKIAAADDEYIRDMYNNIHNTDMEEV